MDSEIGPRYQDVETAEAGHALSVDPDSVVVTYIAYDRATGIPIGHAALRLGAAGLEIKRMFVRREQRGAGVAEQLLAAVERAAESRRERRIVLQTGLRQPEAVRFYERSGYRRIPIFSPYDLVPLSVCYEKVLESPHTSE
ncbi:GNAT family N-acetyltransferase [Nocardia sp. NPDC003482]